MHLFGEHATYVHLLLAPAYRLLAPLFGVQALVVVQSAALGLTGFLLHRLAVREAGRAIALLLLAAYLLYPPLQYTWLGYYQPLALALPALVIAWAAIGDGRMRPAVLAAAFALICFENVSLTVAALGLWALARGQRRLGLVLIATSAAYLALVMGVLFPWLHPGGYVYGYRLYGDFAPDLPAAVRHLLRPDHLVERLARPVNARYVLGLLLPVGFLPLLAPLTLALAAQLPLNLVASWPYAQEVRHHYSALVVPFVFLALIRVFSRLPCRSRARRLAAAALVAGTVSGQALFLPPPLKPRSWPVVDENTREVAGLLARIPRDASLSVHYQFLPHLCHRRRLYMFPDLGPVVSDGLLLDLHLLESSPREATIFRHAQSQGGFKEAARTSSGIVLWLREGLSLAPAPVAPSPPASPPPPPVPGPAAPQPGTSGRVSTQR